MASTPQWAYYYEGTSPGEQLVEDAKYWYIANIWSIVTNSFFWYTMASLQFYSSH